MGQGSAFTVSNILLNPVGSRRKKTILLGFIGLGAVIALRLHELPAVATMECINVAIAEDLKARRRIVQKSSQVELGFDFKGNDVTPCGEVQTDDTLLLLNSI